MAQLTPSPGRPAGGASEVSLALRALAQDVRGKSRLSSAHLGQSQHLPAGHHGWVKLSQPWLVPVSQRSCSDWTRLPGVTTNTGCVLGG